MEHEAKEVAWGKERRVLQSRAEEAEESARLRGRRLGLPGCD